MQQNFLIAQSNLPSNGQNKSSVSNSRTNQNTNINQNAANSNNLNNLNNINNTYNSPVYDNLMYSNLMLSNWLGSVKANNNSLYDGMNSDQLTHKNNMERYIQAEQQQKIMEINRLALPN